MVKIYPIHFGYNCGSHLQWITVSSPGSNDKILTMDYDTMAHKILFLMTPVVKACNLREKKYVELYYGNTTKVFFLIVSDNCNMWGGIFKWWGLLQKQ